MVFVEVLVDFWHDGGLGGGDYNSFDSRVLEGGFKNVKCCVDGRLDDFGFIVVALAVVSTWEVLLLRPMSSQLEREAKVYAEHRSRLSMP